jgi:hypothetical protein
MRSGINVKYTHELSDILTLIRSLKEFSHVNDKDVFEIFKNNSKVFYLKIDERCGTHWLAESLFYGTPIEVEREFEWQCVKLAKPEIILIKICTKFGSKCFICKKIHKNRTSNINCDLRHYFRKPELNGLNFFSDVFSDPFCGKCHALFFREESRIYRGRQLDDNFNVPQVEIFASLMARLIIDRTKKKQPNFEPRAREADDFKYFKLRSRSNWDRILGSYQ